jgi:hypothetical protein
LFGAAIGKDFLSCDVDRDLDLALKTIEDGGGVIDLTSDRIYEWLNKRLKEFGRQTTLFSL